MTVATTDGERIWAFRCSSEGSSRSLFFSTDVQTLREHYPENPVFQEVTEGSRLIVSEPLGDLPGVWNAVPEYCRSLDRALRQTTGRGLPIVCRIESAFSQSCSSIADSSLSNQESLSIWVYLPAAAKLPFCSSSFYRTVNKRFP